MDVAALIEFILIITRAHPNRNLFKLRLGCLARNCSRRFREVDRKVLLGSLETVRVWQPFDDVKSVGG